MASKRLRKSGTWGFTVKNRKCLAKPLYLTFDADADAEGVGYCRKLEKSLDLGYVSPEFRQIM